MRMDIEFSPGARGQRMSAAAREIVALAPCEGGMNGKRFCSMDHPAAICGERAGRTFRERTMGVLWRHSSVNLVEPRPSHWPRRLGLRRLAGDWKAVASRLRRRNRRNGCFDGGIPQKVRISRSFRLRQFTINQISAIQAFGFNDLAGHP
jgi:hypothetical protein